MKGGHTPPVDEGDDAAVTRPYAWFVVGLCVLAGIVDGLDSTVTAFASPLMMKEWGASTKVMGLVLSVSAVAYTIGGAIFAPLGDRFGRRPAILINLFIAGIFTLASGLADSLSALVILRALAGLGIGGLFPNLVALGLEFLPPRSRVVGGILVSCSLSIGAAIGGFAFAVLGPEYGWQSLFYFSGGCTVVVTLICAALLPESPDFLAKSLRSGSAATDQGAAVQAGIPAKGNARGFGALFIALFSGGAASVTITLWAIFSASIGMVYFFLNWLPTVFARAGMPVSAASQASGLYLAGGVVGALLMAPVQNRIGASRVLMICYGIAVVSLLALGQVRPDDPLIFVVIFIVGWGVMGGQLTLNVFASQHYPAEIRATGLGVALAIGRVGGMSVVVATGFLLAGDIEQGYLFSLLALPAAVVIVATHYLSVLQRGPRVAQSGVEAAGN